MTLTLAMSSVRRSVFALLASILSVSNEQAFQCNKAEQHDNKELALTLKEMQNSFKIKSEASDIITTSEWDEHAPDLLLDLFNRKMTENPDA